MATTTKGVPYPLPSDDNEAHTWLQNLATWIDDALGAKTTAQINALTGDARWVGRTVFDSTLGELKVWDGTSWALAGVPVGSVIWQTSSTPDPGYEHADGAEISRSTYARLFSKIGTAFGAGNGSTTFNKPNLKQRTVFGYDGSVAHFNAVGKTGGVLTVTLVTANLPPHTHTTPNHNHTGSVSISSGGSHTHTVSGTASSGGSHSHTVSSHSHTINHDHSNTNTGSTGHGTIPALTVLPSPVGWYNGTPGGSLVTPYYGAAIDVQVSAPLATPPQHTHSVNIPAYSGSSGNTAPGTTTHTGHTHSLDATATTGGSSHSHTGSVTINSGGGSNTGPGSGSSTAITILNPYITLYPMVKV